MSSAKESALPVRPPRDAGEDVGLIGRQPPGVHQEGGQLLARDRADPDRLAARSNRGEQRARFVGHQDEDVPVRRLLERLQERVLDLLVGAVGVLDQDDPPRCGDRRTGRIQQPSPRDGDNALTGGTLLAPGIRRPDHEVGMRPCPCRSAPAARIAGSSIGGGIVAEVERQQIVDEGALAGAGGSVNQQRAAGAAVFDRLLRHASRDRLPEAQKARRRRGLDHRSEYRFGAPGHRRERGRLVRPVAYFVHPTAAVHREVNHADWPGTNGRRYRRNDPITH